MAAIRRGQSQRSVARQWQVTVRTVQKWLTRAAGQRLDRADWNDRRHQGHAAPNRTPATVEAQVLALRDALRERSVLGEYGARAIEQALHEHGAAAPSLRTIGRILQRRGALDGRRRSRRAPSPPGWHLRGVATQQQELDCFDFIEDLKLAGGPLLAVFTAVSLHGRLPGAWPLAPATTTATLGCLAAHWRTHGRPRFAQFDNDTRFQGPHQHRDVIGRVSRCCLQLGTTPIFVPPSTGGAVQPTGVAESPRGPRLAFGDAAFTVGGDWHASAQRVWRACPPPGARATMENTSHISSSPRRHVTT